MGMDVSDGRTYLGRRVGERVERRRLAGRWLADQRDQGIASHDADLRMGTDGLRYGRRMALKLSMPSYST